MTLRRAWRVAMILRSRVASFVRECRSGATARTVSATIVSGTKFGASKDTRIQAGQVQCVQRIPDNALADAVQRVIGPAMSAAELACLEKFYASALGTRYVHAMTNNIDPDKTFSDAEWAQIQAVEKSPQQDKLRKVTGVENPKASATIGGALKPYLDHCLKK